MNFFEVEFTIENCDRIAKEILYSDLDDTNCNSMEETESGYKAYFSEIDFDEEIISKMPILNNENYNIEYSLNVVEEHNWNEVWESNFKNVIVDNKLNIRAAYHPKDEKCEYDLVIEPKMSFGTAHHATTYQMLQLIMGEEISGKTVLDMGCGTSILAIFASLKNADKIIAIDNDKWAFENSLENISLNNISNIDVILGDASSIPDAKFDIIFANINRNILLEDMSKYAEVLKPGGSILFSGFYTEDLEKIKAEAENNNLKYSSHISKDNWVAAKFKSL